MKDNYESAEKLYNARETKYLTQNDIYVTYDNTIKVKENTPVYYRERIPEEKEEIEVEGKVYSRIVKKSYIKDVYEFANDNIKYWELKDYVFNFGLINLQYKFGECLGLNLQYNHSADKYVNTIINLFDLKVFDDKIKKIFAGKYDDWGWRYKEKFIQDLKTKDINDINVTIVILDYGWQNKLKYQISLDTLFKVKNTNIKKHALYYLEIFKEFGLNLENTTYEKRVMWLKKYQNKSQCYIMKDDNTGLYKIGKSVNPVYRERTLQSEKPTIKAIKVFKEDHEDELHKKYSKYRVRGEWFKLNKIQLQYICSSYA